MLHWYKFDYDWQDLERRIRGPGRHRILAIWNSWHFVKLRTWIIPSSPFLACRWQIVTLYLWQPSRDDNKFVLHCQLGEKAKQAAASRLVDPDINFLIQLSYNGCMSWQIIFLHSYSFRGLNVEFLWPVIDKRSVFWGALLHLWDLSKQLLVLSRGTIQAYTVVFVFASLTLCFLAGQTALGFLSTPTTSLSNFSLTIEYLWQEFWLIAGAKDRLFKSQITKAQT